LKSNGKDVNSKNNRNKNTIDHYRKLGRIRKKLSFGILFFKFNTTATLINWVSEEFFCAPPSLAIVW